MLTVHLTGLIPNTVRTVNTIFSHQWYRQQATSAFGISETVFRKLNELAAGGRPLLFALGFCGKRPTVAQGTDAHLRKQARTDREGVGAAYWIFSGKWLHPPLCDNPPSLLLRVLAANWQEDAMSGSLLLDEFDNFAKKSNRAFKQNHPLL